MGAFPIRTSRLAIRLMGSRDMATLCAYRNDPEVAALQNWDLPYTLEMAGWLATQDDLEDLEPTGWTQLAIDHEGRHIGDIAVCRDQTGQQADIGFSLSRAEWGKGYAREAALAVMADLVDRVGVVRITGDTDPRNTASQRVLEAIGLVHTHDAQASFWWRGAWVDTSYYAITADEWRGWRGREMAPPQEVSLVPIDDHTVHDWATLETHWSQRRFVASMAWSYADALFPDIWRGGRLVPVLRGILADGERVGFLMYADRSPAMPDPYLWRMLIDRRHQGRGIGTRAMVLLAKSLRAEGISQMWTTFGEGPGSPRPFYVGLGAQATGEIVDDETAVVLDLADLIARASGPRGPDVTGASTPGAGDAGEDTDLVRRVDECAEGCGFAGVVRVDRAGRTLLASAYGLADRSRSLPNATTTRFAIASGAKTFTALTVMRLVETGVLETTTMVRSLLGDDLPLVADDVTIEHLLAHRSGIGDYLDESALGHITDYAMPLPVHQLATTEDYLQVLDGHPQVARPGERFEYNNAGYVLLALVAERASGRPFPELVRTLVCEPAGLTDTGFERMDELPPGAAIGYLSADGPRSNVLHLPVHGSGDGGMYSTASDLVRFWEALTTGAIVGPTTLAQMLRPISDWPAESRRYGLGFHLHATGEAAWLEGYDAGISFTSLYDPATATTFSVLSNWSDGAWPVVRLLNDWLAG